MPRRPRTAPAGAPARRRQASRSTSSVIVGLLAAHRARGHARDLDLVERHGAAVVLQQAVVQRLAGAGEHLDHLERLDGADEAGDGAEHAGLRAADDAGRRRRLGKQAAVAGRLAALDGHRQARHAQHGAVDQRLAAQHAGVVEQVARREVVHGGHDDVVAVDHGERGGGAQARGVRLERHLGVERRQPLRRHLGLAPADVGGREQDLALQVGELDDVVVDDADAADAGGGEIEEHRRAEPAGADDEHRAGAQRVLAALADLLEDELAVVPLALVPADPHACRLRKVGEQRRREVPLPRVAEDGHDDLARHAVAPRDLAGGPHVGAGGDADEQALLGARGRARWRRRRRRATVRISS